MNKPIEELTQEDTPEELAITEAAARELMAVEVELAKEQAK